MCWWTVSPVINCCCRWQRRVWQGAACSSKATDNDRLWRWRCRLHNEWNLWSAAFTNIWLCLCGCVLETRV